MKSKLSDLFLSELIELACGNVNVLLDNENHVSSNVLASTARSILSEYTFIANRTYAKAVIANKESDLKEKINIMVLKICKSLLSGGKAEEVREILSGMGENVNGDVSSKIEEMLRYAEFEQHRKEGVNEEQKNMSMEEIRSSFYSEIAFMMTYFKMNINANEINAEVYANIVRQANIEIRSMKNRT